MLRILIPVDGSEISLRAVKQVIRLKNEFKGAPEVLLVNVQPPLPMRELFLAGGPSEVRDLEEPLKLHGAGLLATAKEALDTAAIPSRLFVEIGEPASIIASLAKTHHCELIVMGRRGRNALAGFYFGSVATKVLHLSPVPVVMVP
jgi:nucleotide-binding universal stress UspA family protein